MTIQNNELWNKRRYIKATADNAPEGMYLSAQWMDAAVDEAIEAVINAFHENGFNVSGLDPCANLEAQIYSFLKESNPDLGNAFIQAETFGERVEMFP